MQESKNLVGQLFVIGIPGFEIDELTESLIREIQPGGFCLFSRNIRNGAQTRRLTDQLRRLCLLPPIISVDQEGGLVDRLRRITPPMPSVSALGSLPVGDEIVEMAAVSGKILNSLGFNVNFAPVVDVATEARGNFINGLNSRIYGKSVGEVIEFATAYIRTLQDNGCLATIKHFPGLGASQIDSHDNLPVVNIDSREFMDVDLQPFARLISTAPVRSVMVGHAAYPQIEWQEKDELNRYVPSTLSYNVVTKLLRQRLGFDQLVVSDDLEMGAVINNYGIGAASVRAILAGIDMVLICSSPEKIRDGYEAVRAAVSLGEISVERLDESLERIANFRKLLPEPSIYEDRQLTHFSERVALLNTKVRKSI